MTPVRNIELHVSHACNFTCEGCSHYSNQHHKGMLSPEECDRWMAPWSGRIGPRHVSLLGGEPTLNPRFAEFIPLVRRRFPRTRLQIVTNGVLLHRHPRLPLALRDDPAAILYLSIHHDAPEYRAKMKPVLELLREWRGKYRINLVIRKSVHNWTRRYHGFGAEMQPFEDGKPRQSWEQCPARYAAQLFEGKIWKCGPLAYLGMQHAKYGLSAKWEPYLKYRPLEPGCSDAELREFFAREEESYCGMCTAKPEKFRLPLPIPVRRAAARPAQ